MKHIQAARHHRRTADRQQEPLALDPRDPDIVHAHRITRRSDAGVNPPGSHNPAALIPGR